MSAFDDAFESLIGHEGAYSDNPNDPGGETMYGVTATVARGYGYNDPMKDLPLSIAKDIAKKLYWDPLRLDEFDSKVSFQIFDTNYNGGHCVIWMQGASGAKVDGILGPVTIQAIKNTNPQSFILKWNSLRLSYYTSLNSWKFFGKGWSNRIAKNLMKGA